MKQLENKEVMRHYKRYEAYVGAKTTETLIESFLLFSTKALSLVVKIKDAEALQNELKKDNITKELSELKTAAVSGKGLVWVNFTVKAFKMVWHMISTSPEEDEEETWKAISRVMCENCQEHFIDDRGELIHGGFLCETCCDCY